MLRLKVLEEVEAPFKQKCHSLAKVTTPVAFQGKGPPPLSAMPHVPVRLTLCPAGGGDDSASIRPAAQGARKAAQPDHQHGAASMRTSDAPIFLQDDRHPSDGLPCSPPSHPSASPPRRLTAFFPRSSHPASLPLVSTDAKAVDRQTQLLHVFLHIHYSLPSFHLCCLTERWGAMWARAARRRRGIGSARMRLHLSTSLRCKS